MVTNSFFVISFLPTLCSHFKVGRSYSNVPQNTILGRVECSAEGSQNVPLNTILGRGDWVIFTWKLHHLFTIPWYNSMGFYARWNNYSFFSFL